MPRFRRLRLAGRVLAAAAGSAVLLAAAVLLYLSTAGFPSAIIRRVSRRLGEQGVHVRVRRARLSVLEGIVLKDLRLYDSPAAAAPVIEAHRMAVGLNALEWILRRHGVVGLRVRGARVQMRLAERGGSGRSAQLVLDRVNTAVQLHPGGLDIQGLYAETLGMQFQGAGTIRQRLPRTGEPVLSGAGFLENTPPWVFKLIEQIKELRFKRPPQLRVEFVVLLDDPAQSKVTVKAQGRLTQTPVGAFDTWSLEAALFNSRLSLKSLVLRQGPSRLRVTGAMSLKDRTTEFRLFSDLPLRHWMAIMPRAWRKRLSESDYVLQGKASLELWGGPAPLAELRRHLGGWLSLEQAECGGVWVEKAFLSARREEDVITLERLDGVVGRGAGRGPLKASGKYHLASGEYHGEFKGAFNPHLWKPLLQTNQTKVLDWFVFGETPPSGEVEFSGRVGDLQTLNLHGKITASAFTYRGVSVSEGDALMDLRGDVMRLNPLGIARKEGVAEGWLELDFNNHVASFQLDSTVDPHAVANMIGPASGRFLESYRFEGNAHVIASGRVSYADVVLVDVEAWIEGTRLGLGWALSDQASFRVRALDRRLEFTDIQANVYGGRLTGRMAFYPLNTPRRLQYDAVGQLRQLNMEKLIAGLTGEEAKFYQGMLSADFRVEGMVGEGRSRTAVGEGWITIEDGTLFQIPLMGELSQWLTRLYPGLGFATQTDFRTNYRIKDGAFHTEDAMLEGAMLSLKGKGDYFFDQRLDVVVQVQPMRDGIVAEAVRLATSPLTKLLEFKLAGTLREPKWRPLNLPKEMFLIFD
ncbi:MAG: AsmA-like C-terminal region-containing protein [Verrucomicrobia bacterium]|nr:AsmA-like C-terminal region-containing protein [Verrucomicrobiota bacterium]